MCDRHITQIEINDIPSHYRIHKSYSPRNVTKKQYIVIIVVAIAETISVSID